MSSQVAETTIEPTVEPTVETQPTKPQAVASQIESGPTVKQPIVKAPPVNAPLVDGSDPIRSLVKGSGAKVPVVNADLEELQTEPLDPKRLRRNPLMSKLSWMLVAALIACGGFVAGAKANNGSASSSGIPGLPSGGGLPALPAGIDIASLLGGGATGSKSSAVLPSSTTSTGEIVLVTRGKVYVRMPDGKTKAVSVTSGTKVSTATASDVSALTVGKRVLVDGRTEDSGVIAANAVVIQPN
jgi:hypothetical protein